ncbi:B3 DNA binding domain containing protein [Parasponia andersonii]|uniref:B3 DNA binding domain containing protein n=1 Tax=Parasponia andersonii TaxID=3476 RepID=A0A2P5BZ57_PARAD|nr:B3 DNA binding domain containing protein [Parasponia andersonii]
MSRSCRGDSDEPKFLSGTPHFFKIILEDTLQDNKLQVPRKFLSKCGETLSTSVSIKLPCGSRWEMKLRKDDDKFWLDQGWPEFVKHYSIGRGHMLTFRYYGNSEFHAVIFDTSTVEIDYPSVPFHFDESSIDGKLREPKREVIDGDFVEMLDDFSPCHKAGLKMSLPLSRPPKRMKTSPTGKSGSPARSGRHKSNPIRKRKFEILRRVRTLDRRERLAALQRTCGFGSELPFFKVVMQPYYVLGKFLSIPANFENIYLKNRSDNVILKVPNGEKTWPVKYVFGVQKRTAPRFRRGWKAFAQDNNLKVGDVCVFILLKEIKFSFEVVIFRVGGSLEAPISPAHDETGMPSFRENFHAKQANGCKSTPWKTSQNTEPQVVRKPYPLAFEKVRILEKAPFQSEKPYFRVVIQPSYKWNVHVPLALAVRHIMNEGDVVLSTPNGRSWSAQFRMRKFAAVICSGWKEFVADNGLEVGDVCNFELLDGTKILFQVSIVRVSDDYKGQESQAGDFAKGKDKPKVDEAVKLETD